MICYGKLADHFLNVLFSGFKWLELLSRVSGTVELSCTGIELHFFLSHGIWSANFTDIIKARLHTQRNHMSAIEAAS